MKILIVGGIAVLYYYYAKRKAIPSSWLEQSGDVYYILPVASFSFEDDVMKYKEIIMREGENNGIEASVIAGIIAKESKGIPSKTNGRFMGLMQFGFVEARAMGFKGESSQLLNPEVNIKWGSKYLKYCIDQKDDVLKGVSGYNTGQVERTNTPYNASYVDEILGYVPRFRYLLFQYYPGYANVFPKETWVKTDVVYA